MKNTTMNDMRGLFGDEADHYDATIRLVDPLHKEMHKVFRRLACEHSVASDNANVPALMALDIGFGTGADAIALLREISHLKLVGVDRSPEMSGIFSSRANKARVANRRYRLLTEDILSDGVEEKIRFEAQELSGKRDFHLVLSALTLHHFTHDEKLSVFKLAFDMLAPGGVFLLSDLFNYKGESDWLETTIDRWEKGFIGDNFDGEIEKAGRHGDSQKVAILRRLKDKWLGHYGNENKLESMSDQLDAMKNIGFSDVGNPFRYWQVGLLFAKKGK